MYTAFYQLKEEPFRLTPDPRFLHLADPHRTALKALLQGVLQRKGFIVVAGPVGTGKTTLLHTALQILTEKSEGRGRLVSAFLVNPTLSPSELLEAVLDEYEISTTATSKPKRLAALHQMLFQTQQQGGTAVLLVDEAHLMSLELLEEVRLLGNTDTYQEKLLQIVLCGQPELLAVLQRPELQALQQRIANTCLLRPLALPETRAYIAERLHAAGLNGNPPFTSAAVETIHKLSGGTPRLINLLSDACLTLGFETKQRQIDPLLVEQAGEEVLSVFKPSMLSVDAPPAGNISQPEQKPAASAVTWSSVAAPAPQALTKTNARVAKEVVATNSKVPAAEAESESQKMVMLPGTDGNWTKSTFDVLIAALKQNRASARR
jgi:general secretion pathway protein A